MLYTECHYTHMRFVLNLHIKLATVTTLNGRNAIHMAYMHIINISTNAKK